jgi:hypothetical protein
MEAALPGRAADPPDPGEHRVSRPPDPWEEKYKDLRAAVLWAMVAAAVIVWSWPTPIRAVRRGFFYFRSFWTGEDWTAEP